MSGPELRGALIARNHQQAQVGLDRMSGIIGAQGAQAHLKDWLILTPRSYSGARGQRLPNRVLIYDMDMVEIADEVWHTLIPAIRRDGGEALNVYHFGLVREHPLVPQQARR